MFKKICLLFALVACAKANYGGGYGGQLAVHTRQHVQYIDTPSSGFVQPTNVHVQSQSPPINFLMRTFSSPINIRHVHIPSPGSFRATSSVDEPHIRVHTVTRPIIQELNEIITPRRLITQQVLPVQESVQTIIARGVAQNRGGSGGFIGGGNSQFF